MRIELFSMSKSMCLQVYQYSHFLIRHFVYMYMRFKDLFFFQEWLLTRLYLDMPGVLLLAYSVQGVPLGYVNIP